jgi:hypothetical protein
MIFNIPINITHKLTTSSFGIVQIVATHWYLKLPCKELSNKLLKLNKSFVTLKQQKSDESYSFWNFECRGENPYERIKVESVLT